MCALLDEATLVSADEEQESNKGHGDCSSGTALMHIVELRLETCQ